MPRKKGQEETPPPKGKKYDTPPAVSPSDKRTRESRVARGVSSRNPDPKGEKADADWWDKPAEKGSVSRVEVQVNLPGSQAALHPDDEEGEEK